MAILPQKHRYLVGTSSAPNGALQPGHRHEPCKSLGDGLLDWVPRSARSAARSADWATEVVAHLVRHVR